MRGHLIRSTGRWVSRAIAGTALLGFAGVAAASSPPSEAAAFFDSVHSVAHLVGLGASATLAYYAVQARRKFAGGAFGEAATFVLVGAIAFAVAFLVREVAHGFGIDVVAFAPGQQTKMAINMVLFTGTVFAFGWAFYRTASALEGA